MSDPRLAAALDQALQLCQSGALQDAEALYRQVTAAYPDAADGWNMLALLLCQRGALDEAAQASRRATALRATIAPYWLTAGNIAMARQQHEEAQAAFRRATRLDPTFAVAHYRLGLSHHRQLAYAAAADCYRQALRHAPDVAEIHAQLAEAYVALDKWVEAMHAYGDAFRRDPDGALDRRSGLECLQRMKFDVLPELWHAEILRFFGRRDLDRKPYVSLALKALETRPYFRAALDAAPEAALAARDVREIEHDGLFLTLLRDCLIPEPRFERLLTRLRARLLSDAAARAAAPAEFLAALSLQCFLNEFACFQTDVEQAQADALQADAAARLASAAALDDATLRAVAVLGMYRPLHRVPDASRLTPYAGGPYAELWGRAIHDVLAEARLRPAIPAIADTAEALEADEAAPYPRWFFLDREPPFPLSEWLARELPAQPPAAAASPVQVLVAGCGTGKDAAWIAANLADSQVLGVDPSRANLAHAQRMAGELGVANVSFRCGDIRALDAVGERFDVVVAAGALHRMRDPYVGLAALRRLARPGALLKIGLYSSTGRSRINAARALVGSRYARTHAEDIRALRRRVLDAPADSALKELAVFEGFYATGTCGDLLLPGEAHEFDVPQIEALCRDHRLEFLGFAELPREVLGRYRRMFPQDAHMDDLDHWHAFEQAHPATFSNAYLFWARRR